MASRSASLNLSNSSGLMATSNSPVLKNSTGTSPKPAEEKTPLLNAWHDPLANIRTNQSCVKLVDLHCDGDSKLCVCDYDKKLRVYKGASKAQDYPLLDIPIALCITYIDASMVREMKTAILLLSFE
jgi:hypothetical protein